MQEIKTITAHGITYSIKDETARESIVSVNDNVTALGAKVSDYIEDNADYINNILATPFIYIEQEDLTYLEGFNENSLIAFTTNYVYNAFDSYIRNEPSFYTMTKELIGYGSDANGEEDITLPIYCYHYKPTENENYSRRLKIVLTSALNGNEKVGTFAMLHLLDMGINKRNNRIINEIVGKYEIDFIPVCNPYGFNLCSTTNITQQLSNVGRNNARDVDLNRNFVYGWNYSSDENKGVSANSETETKALVEYLTSVNWDNVILMLDLHQTWGNQSLTDYKDVAQAFTNDTKLSYVYCNNYSKIGSLANKLYNIDMKSQYLIATGKVIQNAGQMIFKAMHLKGNENNVGVIECGKASKEGDNYILNDHNIICAYLSILYTTILAYCNDNTFKNEFISLSLKAFNYSINNQFEGLYDNWENATYAENNKVFASNRLLYANDINITTGDKIHAEILNGNYQLIVYYVSADGTISGNSGWTSEFDYDNTSYSKIRVVIRKPDDSNIYINNLYKDFIPILTISK